MFPDTQSSPSETKVLMGSMRLRRWHILLAWLVVVLFSLIALYSLYQMNRLGLLPGSVSWDEVSFFAYSRPFQPARVIIPVTGLLPELHIQRTFVDDFTLDTGDWSALQGSVSISDGSMRVSPDWLEQGGLAVWNLPDGLLTDAFIFSADLTTQAQAFQRLGLAIDVMPDGSGILAVVEPDTGNAAIYQRSGNTYSALASWQESPTLLPAPDPNRIEVECNADRIVLRINGVDVAGAAQPLPCNQGQVAAFVLTPGQSILVDNVSLSILK